MSSAVETIPQRFRWAVFAAPELSGRCGSESCRHAQEVWPGLLAGEPDVALLMGPVGKGKTSLACAMLRAVIAAGHALSYSSRFVRAITLATARHESRLGVRPFELDLADVAGVLLLDDLGQERDITDVSEVIRVRHDAQRPTIITTVLGPMQMEQRYGGGIGRRLLERCAQIVWS